MLIAEKLLRVISTKLVVALVHIVVVLVMLRLLFHMVQEVRHEVM